MSLNVFLFYVIAGLTGLSAVAMVVSQNIVRAAAWLLFTLAGVSGIFFLLGAEFVGATQLFIYVGGTLVLVIFGVMLTAQGPFVNLKPRSGEWVISMSVGLLLFGTLTASLLTAKPMQSGFAERSEPGAEMTDVEKIGLGFLNVESASGANDARMTGVDLNRLPPHTSHSRKRIGYLLPFEIVSVHLLVVLVGAAYLARTKRRRDAKIEAEPSS